MNERILDMDPAAWGDMKELERRSWASFPSLWSMAIQPIPKPRSLCRCTAAGSACNGEPSPNGISTWGLCAATWQTPDSFHTTTSLAAKGQQHFLLRPWKARWENSPQQHRRGLAKRKGPCSLHALAPAVAFCVACHQSDSQDTGSDLRHDDRPPNAIRTEEHGQQDNRTELEDERVDEGDHAEILPFSTAVNMTEPK